MTYELSTNQQNSYIAQNYVVLENTFIQVDIFQDIFLMSFTCLLLSSILNISLILGFPQSCDQN